MCVNASGMAGLHDHALKKQRAGMWYVEGQMQTQTVSGSPFSCCMHEPGASLVPNRCYLLTTAPDMHCRDCPPQLAVCNGIQHLDGLQG